MAKLWSGRTSGATSKIADEFDSSIPFDSRMYKEDIEGSIAHARMLGKQGILPAESVTHIIEGLQGILEDLNSGALEIDETSEDIHMFVEEVLTQRIGDEGKMLHTARSRNDQVANDFRLYLRNESVVLNEKIRGLIRVLNEKAEQNIDTIMPGYTHLQRAQPIFFAHHLLAYEMMFLRDLGRIEDACARMDDSVIGACAFAGTSYDIDREYEASLLGFSSVSKNSIDSVSDRDFCLELLSAFSILMMHMSRLSEELLLWTSWEFGFITLDDAFTTGSSIMPQKKNSDMAELIRGKTGRVYGDLMGLLTVMKGLPLAYNKDMQEDKEPVMDALDTVNICLDVMTPMIETMTVKAERMKQAAREGFINATDLADYLTKKGMPFRTAYKICGEIVSDCMKKGLVLENYPLSSYKEYSELFEEDVYPVIDLTTAADSRSSEGGTSRSSIRKQIEFVGKLLENG
ncbi:MAG: argininosuccinate lyase [Solobacterium sp.]|nr:argininosuccinate lyase [Solobacterium sp.]